MYLSAVLLQHRSMIMLYYNAEVHENYNLGLLHFYLFIEGTTNILRLFIHKNQLQRTINWLFFSKDKFLMTTLHHHWGGNALVTVFNRFSSRHQTTNLLYIRNTAYVLYGWPQPYDDFMFVALFEHYRDVLNWMEANEWDVRFEEIQKCRFVHEFLIYLHLRPIRHSTFS